jgi:hypothetical protein
MLNYSKIKNITSLPYKKFGINFPHFNQNHPYVKSGEKDILYAKVNNIPF